MNLPTVITTRACDDGVSLGIDLATATDAFAGHFPGYPVLPGVYQIDWALRLAVRHLGLGEAVAQDFDVKFRQLIRPTAALRLHLQLDPGQRMLRFEYLADDEPASSGKIRLECHR